MRFYPSSMRTGLISAFAAMVIAASVAWAGSPHFVGACTVTRAGDNLTVSCKEAGLGDEAQINVLITAEAACINPGNNNPKADNKDAVAADLNVPVQNGKANYTTTLIADFQPDCSPPMTIEWTNVLVNDVTNGISQSFAGPFLG